MKSSEAQRGSSRVVAMVSQCKVDMLVIASNYSMRHRVTQKQLGGAHFGLLTLKRCPKQQQHPRCRIDVRNLKRVAVAAKPTENWL